MASLKAFLATGTFGSIEPEAGHAAIEKRLGPPEDWEAGARHYQKAKIWKYGDIEFHFRDDALVMIFLNHIGMPSGGQALELDPWVINVHLLCEEAEKSLAAAGIAYEKEDFPINENGVRLITGAGTVMQFTGEDAARGTIDSMWRKIGSAS